MPIRITLLNVKGLNHPGKRYSLWSEARKLHSDVLCFQVTHFCHDKAPKMSHKNVPHIFCANSQNKTKGVLIAIRDTAAFNFISRIADPLGSYLILIYKMNNATFTIVNLYAPNTGQLRFLWKLLKKVHKNQQGRTLFCGDFNLVPDPSIDVKGTTTKLH